jgi:DNA-binding transcriptional LysR family regulator
MNVHHLELFYYVAKHGGISAAVRNFPYGIQQPAVSGQIRQLEEDTGTKLFERTPFRLTLAGERLFEHVRPFFENLDGIAAQLKGIAQPELRIGGAEIVLRDHVPAVMKQVRARHPEVRLRLHTGYDAQLLEWLRNNTIDIAITSTSARPPAKLQQLPIVRIPLVLLVHRSSPFKSAEEILARKRIPEPLVAQPATTSFMQSFQRDLKRRRVIWPQAVEATTGELVMRYVANGEGFGMINQAVLMSVKHPDVRALPLAGFEPLIMAVLWRGEKSALVHEVIDGVQHYARETFPKWKCPEEPPWRTASKSGGSARHSD